VRNPPARLRTYLALSRTPHALLDLAAPAVAALMWTDGFHPPEVTALGLLTVFAAYTAVYALNDIIDREADRRKVLAGYREAGGYLDAVLVRHPLARGLLTTRQALAWALSWAAVAAAGSLVLNPVCLVLFMGGFAAEIAYCRLACVSPWRALLSGVVKTLGPLAAVLVVDPSPSPLPFALLGLWVFLVEIGGQNVPSDWTDLEEDRKLGAATIPARLGEATAAVLALAALAAAVAVQLALVTLLARAHRLELAAMSLAAGVALLLLPAARLAACRRRDAVFRLFNRASAYPAALLAAMVAKLLLL
jgi:4-hydroxybenzoate polyprenyltransferase